MESTKKYSFLKGLWKGMLGVVLVGAPILVSALPQEWMNYTIGGVLLMIVNFLKVRYAK